MENLSACLQSATFASVIAAVVVQFYLNIRFLQLLSGDESELKVLDAQSAVEPLLLVVGADREYIIGLSAIVEVGGIHLGGQVVYFHQCVGVGVQEVAVGLEVYDAVGF